MRCDGCLGNKGNPVTGLCWRPCLTFRLITLRTNLSQVYDHYPKSLEHKGFKSQDDLVAERWYRTYNIYYSCLVGKQSPMIHSNNNSAAICIDDYTEKDKLDLWVRLATYNGLKIPYLTLGAAWI